jgi:hypothetical protein
VVRGKYENFMAMDGEYIVSSYPMPPIPEEYDANYRPVSLIIVSFSREDVFRVVKEVDTLVDETVMEITVISITVGVIGLVLATAIIFMMAHMLTFPLSHMDKVASEIVNNFGDPTTRDDEIKGSEGKISKEAMCTPKTELSQVVKEFNKMVTSFSGSFMARSEKGKYEEVNNLFRLRTVFSKLYKSRNDENFVYKIEKKSWPTHDKRGEDSDPEDFIHNGSNLLFSESVTNTVYSSNRDSNRDSIKSKVMSPIFLWTVALIVTPLLAVNITISAVVMHAVSEEFTESIATAKENFLDVQKDALKMKTRLRASYVSGLTVKSTSELHILTRYSSWLLFGGLRRANSFTEFTTGLEVCKGEPDFNECDYVRQNLVCDCDWNDRQFRACKTYPGGSRHLQVPFFSCESQGTEFDGDRDSTVFPNASFSAETTAWWDNATTVPGWEKSSSASGYDFTYDRLRVISALPMLQVLYNADLTKERIIALYVAFEADGLVVGYTGCNTPHHVTYPEWVSSEKNKAAELRPELCPLGKHGYDPR